MAQEARRVVHHLRRARHGERSLFRMASYNVHGCMGTDRCHDVERIAQVIRDLGCDTVGLQEVDVCPGLLSDSVQLEFLAGATDMTAVLGPLQLGSHRQRGNALLTQREVVSVRHHELTAKGCEPRSVLEVGLRAGRGVLRVMVTQLGSHAVERGFQVKRLLAIVKSIPPDQPLVVLADINQWLPLGRAVRWLDHALGKQQRQRSYPVWAPLVAMDRVWTRAPAALLTVETHKSAYTRRASNHLPVKAAIIAGAPARRGAWA